MPSLSLTRRQALLLGAVLLVLLAVAGKRLAATGASQAPPAASLVAAGNGSPGSPRVAKLVVHVAGSVRRAGVYRLPEGARVAEAIARAGGATRRADTGALNLAAPLADGQQVLVPRRAPPAQAGAPSSAAAPPTKVSLSTATVEQLDELPGVGPVTAAQIVEWRTANGPFRSVDDLDQVPGIGPARLEQLREAATP